MPRERHARRQWQPENADGHRDKARPESTGDRSQRDSPQPRGEHSRLPHPGAPSFDSEPLPLTTVVAGGDAGGLPKDGGEVLAGLETAGKRYVSHAQARMREEELFRRLHPTVR